MAGANGATGESASSLLSCWKGAPESGALVVCGREALATAEFWSVVMRAFPSEPGAGAEASGAKGAARGGGCASARMSS